MGTGSINITPTVSIRALNYITYADIESRVTDLDVLTSSPPTGQTAQQYVESLIADAEAEIDSYLRVAYTVPISPVSDDIIMVAIKLVRHALLRDNYHQESAEVNEWVATFRTEALATLKALVTHQQQLNTSVNSTNSIQSTTPTSNRIFTAETTAGW